MQTDALVRPLAPWWCTSDIPCHERLFSHHFLKMLLADRSNPKWLSIGKLSNRILDFLGINFGSTVERWCAVSRVVPNKFWGVQLISLCRSATLDIHHFQQQQKDVKYLSRTIKTAGGQGSKCWGLTFWGCLIKKEVWAGSGTREKEEFSKSRVNQD